MNTVIISRNPVFDHVGDKVADSKSVTFIPSTSQNIGDIKKENIYIVLKNDVDSNNLYFIATGNQEVDSRVMKLSREMESAFGFPVPIMVRQKTQDSKITKIEKSNSRNTSWYSIIAQGESLGLGNVVVLEVGGIGDLEGFSENIVKIVESA